MIGSRHARTTSSDFGPALSAIRSFDARRRRRVGRRHRSALSPDRPASQVDHRLRSQSAHAARRCRAHVGAFEHLAMADWWPPITAGRRCPIAAPTWRWRVGHCATSAAQVYWRNRGSSRSPGRSRRCSACCGPAARSSSSRRWGPAASNRTAAEALAAYYRCSGRRTGLSMRRGSAPIIKFDSLDEAVALTSFFFGDEWARQGPPTTTGSFCRNAPASGGKK